MSPSLHQIHLRAFHMLAILRLEYTCTKSELEQAQSLHLRKQLGGGTRWQTWLVLGIILLDAGVRLLLSITPLAAKNLLASGYFGSGGFNRGILLFSVKTCQSNKSSAPLES
jgi:hypothetical protein